MNCCCCICSDPAHTPHKSTRICHHLTSWKVGFHPILKLLPKFRVIVSISFILKDEHPFLGALDFKCCGDKAMGIKMVSSVLVNEQSRGRTGYSYIKIKVS